MTSLISSFTSRICRVRLLNTRRYRREAQGILLGLLAAATLGLVGGQTDLVGQASASPGPCTTAHTQVAGQNCSNSGLRYQENCNPGNIRYTWNAGSALHGTFALGTGILAYQIQFSGQFIGAQCGLPATSTWILSPQGWVSRTTVF